MQMPDPDARATVSLGTINVFAYATMLLWFSKFGIVASASLVGSQAVCYATWSDDLFTTRDEINPLDHLGTLIELTVEIQIAKSLTHSCE
jgi:hypothetical protein